MDLITLYLAKREEKKDSKKEVGRRLKMQRKKLRVNQTYVAKCLGIETKSLREVESGNIEGELALVQKAYEVFLFYNGREKELNQLLRKFSSLKEELKHTAVAVVPPQRRRSVI